MEIQMNIYDELEPEILNSFAFDYKNKKEETNWRTIRDETDVTRLRDAYTKFQTLSDRIIGLSKDFFKKVIDKDTTHDNKMYYDLSCIYIAEIQNLYLNPINYQINKLKSEESLSKANNSICWAKISIWIAIGALLVSTILSVRSIRKTVYYGENPTLCTCCSAESAPIEISQTTTEQDGSKITDTVLPLKSGTDTSNSSKITDIVSPLKTDTGTRTK